MFDHLNTPDPANHRGSEFYENGKLKDGYIASTTAIGGLEEVGSIKAQDKRERTKSTVKRTKGKTTYFYKKPEEKTQSAPPPTPTPKPEPKEEKTVEKGPVAYSPEIQKAKSKVMNYKSPYGGESASTEDRGYNSFGSSKQPQVDPQGFLDKYKMDFKMKPAVNDVSVGA